MIVFIAVTTGLIGGVVIAYLVARTLLLRYIVTPRDRALGAILTVAGVLLVLLPGFFLSIVVGGNLGGAYGEYVSQSIGAGSNGVPVGLALGIGVVLCLALVVGALIGIGATKAVILFRSWRVRT